MNWRKGVGKTKEVTWEETNAITRQTPMWIRMRYRIRPR
jgi:hypothetical protein